MHNRNRVQKFNGKASYRIIYRVCIDKDTANPTSKNPVSFVQFRQVCRTENGMVTKNNLVNTPQIPLTSVMFDADPCNLKQFAFTGNWRDGRAARALSQQNVVATVNIEDNKIQWTNTHAQKADGLGAIFTATGVIAETSSDCQSKNFNDIFE